MYYLRRISSGVAVVSGIMTILSAWIVQAQGGEAPRRMLIGAAIVFGLAVLIRIGVAITRPLWGGPEA